MSLFQDRKRGFDDVFEQMVDSTIMLWPPATRATTGFVGKRLTGCWKCKQGKLTNSVLQSTRTLSHRYDENVIVLICEGMSLLSYQVSFALLKGSWEESKDPLEGGAISNGGDPGTVAAVVSSLAYLRDRVSREQPYICSLETAYVNVSRHVFNDRFNAYETVCIVELYFAIVSMLFGMLFCSCMSCHVLLRT